MTAFKVMNWNVENLFLPDQLKPESQQDFQDKLAKLAAVIDTEQPDVLALQEVGPNGALAALQQAGGGFSQGEQPGEHQQVDQQQLAHRRQVALRTGCR